MPAYKVRHKSYGEGIVTEIQNGVVVVTFKDVVKRFGLKGFEKFFDIMDPELQTIVKRENSDSVNKARSDTRSHSKELCAPTPTVATYNSNSVGALLGPRSQTISIVNERLMFEIVGYLARPGRISSIEAEVPKDGRHTIFEELFPGQTYRPITMGDTPSGMPNKLSSQFRINLANIRNCPSVLRENMGAGNSGCVGRINKSRFVLNLVQKYGFRFGEHQDEAGIRSIASEKGYLAEYEKGYSL